MTGRGGASPERRRRVLGIVGLLVAAQLLALGWFLWRYESTHRDGEVYRFVAAPWDPVDPFRGRYVRLTFPISRERLEAGPGEAEHIEAGDRVWATVQVDAEGFAQLRRVSRDRPATGPVLRVRVRSADSSGVRVDLPFDRLYLEESLAPEVERRFRSVGRGADGSTVPSTWVSVRIDDAGRAALETLWLEGEPVPAATAPPEEGAPPGGSSAPGQGDAAPEDGTASDPTEIAISPSEERR